MDHLSDNVHSISDVAHPSSIVHRSIFNDVLGPIMSGPSSSHSAGCARIGRMVRLLYGKEIRKAHVIYDSGGSYPKTHVGQGSDFGFTGGLLGFNTEDPQMKDAIFLAAQRGVTIWFSEENLYHRHPNEARIDVYCDNNDTVELTVLTYSTGGGAFEIVEMDGFPVYIDGSFNQLYVCCSIEEGIGIEKILSAFPCSIHQEIQKNRILFCVSGYHPDQETNILSALSYENIYYCRKAPAILPIPIQENASPLFTTAAQAVKLSRQTGRSAWELAVDYERSIGNISYEKIISMAAHLIDIMRSSTMPPDPKSTQQYGFQDYTCLQIRNTATVTSVLDLGVLNNAILYAQAVMENSCAHNIIVAAPTAGSSGVLPGALLAVSEARNCSPEDIVHALLVSGLVGVLITNQATFSAEAAGCQAENGAASAMAAAGIVYLLGGTIDQGFMAASMALQNLLGLICDPVAGLTQVPCIGRNLAAVGNAVICANMVLLGYDPVIPLDETIQVLMNVGKLLPAALRCTCEGGLCTSLTGQRIMTHIQKTNCKDICSSDV